MKLTIIIVNYNVRYFLEQCLHSVMKACNGITAEIIVVDNNSVDGSVEMVKEKFPSAHIIANKDNKGFSKANNQGIAIALGEYILLLNPDTIVEEDTFIKCITFMDSHPQAGGLGVKMIDGSGKFLPESKRGLPTPEVAFYKMSGLARLFPRSKTFGRYHLGFLNEDNIAEVDILAGAFMLLRKSALDKVGVLDEDFFMYGEDIDLSYRLTKGGYKNFYFPETRIIHYKGESTKKSSVNYVKVFYNAMIIFAQKHFTKSNAARFALLIRIAVYFRAAAALLNRFFKKAMLPILDLLLLYVGMYLLKNYWSNTARVNYPDEFMFIAVPIYIFTWIISVYFSGGYDRPIRLQKIIRGVFSGTLIILVVYALLPEMYRFSRALILIGAVLAMAEMVISRLLLSLTGVKTFTLDSTARKRLLIVGEEDEASRVLSLLKMSETTHNFIGYVHANHSTKNGSALKSYDLGNSENLQAIAELYDIDEIIFCARDVASNTIISHMSSITRDLEFKIAPPESLFIIGSNSVNSQGQMYIIDINSIAGRVNQRNKRVFDLMASIVLLILSPVIIFFQKKPGKYFRNIFRVLSGTRSWVGYYGTVSTESLPKIREGILNPVMIIRESPSDAPTINRLNALYAKDYHVNTDLQIIIKGVRLLGS